jgi:hypothetical protein
MLVSVLLPAAVFFSAITPVNGKLVLSGPLDAGPRCGYMTVEPATLRTAFTKRPCVRDAVRVRVDRRSQWWPVYVGRRLAFRYEDGSTSRPVSARYGATLWVYDVLTQRGPILQRWSLRTGRLERELRFPVRLWRPVLVANAAGAWLMAAPNGGESGSPTAALWHASDRVTAVHRSERAAMWMTVHGRTLWLETVAHLRTFELWRYDGARGRLLSAHAPPYLWHTSYAAGALWGAAAPYCGKRLRALRIDAQTGAATTLATLRMLECGTAGASAYADGALWLVDGDRLYRIG